MEEEDLQHLESIIVGLSLPAAEDMLRCFQCEHRVFKRGELLYDLAANYNPKRLNLSVDVHTNKVISVKRG